MRAQRRASSSRSRRRRSRPRPPVTRRSDRESVDKGFSLGVTDFLVKPASADVVAAKIRLALDTAPGTATRATMTSVSDRSRRYANP